MLARLTRQPFDSPDHLFELKWDGIRALAFVDGGKLRLQGRDLKDLTPLFPELTGLPEMVETHDTVLDGELVCFDNEGKPSLELMHRRLKRQAEGRVVRNPKVHFVAFDLLFLGGSSVMDEPLSLRKTLLQEVVRPSENVQACEFIDTEGRAFFQATCDLGLEGIMAKDKSGVYLAGKRSPGWQKIKRARGVRVRHRRLRLRGQAQGAVQLAAAGTVRRRPGARVRRPGEHRAVETGDQAALSDAGAAAHARLPVHETAPPAGVHLLVRARAGMQRRVRRVHDERPAALPGLRVI